VTGSTKDQNAHRVYRGQFCSSKWASKLIMFKIYQEHTVQHSCTFPILFKHLFEDDYRVLGNDAM